LAFDGPALGTLVDGVDGGDPARDAAVQDQDVEERASVRCSAARAARLPDWQTTMDVVWMWRNSSTSS
jgi:hypothetical protein